MAALEWQEAPRELAAREQHVDVWRADLKALGERGQDYRALLAPEERARADRFIFDVHRRRFTITRGTLRLILGRYLSCDPARLSFDYGAHGKPALAAPWSSSGLSFNLSHSADWALYAVTAGCALGIDIEQRREQRDTLAIARRYFSAREWAALSALAPAEQEHAFFLGWTRKEAVIKAEGTGLARSLESFTVALAPGEPAALLAMDDDPAEAARWSMRDLDVGPGYAAALVLAGAARPIRCFEAVFGTGGGFK